MHSNQRERLRAVLVSVALPHVTKEDVTASILELRRLCETLGFDVIASLTQARKACDPATVVGKGKLEEVAQLLEGETGEKVDIVVFDCELSPTQSRNLEERLGVTVMDRVSVILEIFSRHARTREAKAQVELARLDYLLPRLRAKSVGGDRQRGGSGGGLKARGPGETPYEIERRTVKRRMAALRHEIETIAKSRETRETQRRDVPSIALIGYTNAGKSSLMRALTGTEVLVEDKLFATLDTTARVLRLPSDERIVVTDTVGFIRHLPHHLVASFRSTLREAMEADVPVIVADASDPALRSHLAVVHEVLKENGGYALRPLLVLNKVDLIDDATKAALREEFPRALFVSTRSRADVEKVRDEMVRRARRKGPAS